MSLGGLIARAALLREQLTKKPCKRCGFLFDPEKDDRCPRCSELSDAEVSEIIEAREIEYESHRVLGKWFLAGAIFASFVLLVSFL